jgi:predicted RNase H-like HicB family nuclease
MSWFGKKKMKFLTGRLFLNKQTGKFIAYFEEFPELTVQGDSETDVKERLIRGLRQILAERRSPIENREIGEYSEVNHFELTAAI